MSKKHAGKVLEARIGTVVAVSLILSSSEISAVAAELETLANGQRDYFDHELAVLELVPGTVDAAALDWKALLGLLRDWNLNPVAVRGAPAELHPALHALGLSIDEVASRPPAAAPQPPAPVEAEAKAKPKAAPAPAAAKPAAPAPAAAAAAAGRSAMIVDTPVRGGQRIYARGADLIVTAMVNPGAELIADGSIHVYAPLRGRALAGASGDASARIFTLAMEAELVSIAGIYRTFDEGQSKETARQATEVRLLGDRLDLRAVRN